MSGDTFNQAFEALLRRYIGFIVLDIRKGLRRARDKQYMRASTKEWIEGVLENYRTHEIVGELCMFFIAGYKQGDDIKAMLVELHKAYVRRVLDSNRANSGAEEVESHIATKRKESYRVVLAKTLLKSLAFTEVYERYDEIVSEPLISIDGEFSEAERIALNWTNLISTKENKNDFVQLIYALHQAGYINQGRGEITKIVEQAASVFNVKLGNNWQSNHSASIHKAKRDYEPAIFKKIQEAYKFYTDELIAGKRKRR